jgi:hypothetical protein
LRFFAAAAALAGSLSLAGAAQAGIYTDDLSKCLVKSTTSADRLDLIVWIFDAISSHPAVSSMTTITQAQREGIDKKAAQLLTRLLLEDCRAQTVDAVKYESSGAIQQSFGVLGEVAMSGLMSDATVAKNIGGIAQYVDEDKFKTLMTDAGQIQAPAKK